MENKEKYMTLLFCKIKDSYFSMDSKNRTTVSKDHAASLRKYSKNITHLVCTGFNGQYDQVILLEGDDLRSIHDAAELFRIGAKARHIEVVDTVFGLKVENKSDFVMIGNR